MAGGELRIRAQECAHGRANGDGELNLANPALA